MLGDNLCDGMSLGLALKIAADPAAFRPCENVGDARLVLRQWAIVEIRRVVQMTDGALAIDFDKQQPFRDDAPVPGFRDARILDGMFEIK